MNRIQRIVGKLFLGATALLALLPVADALPFTSQYGDLALGFRKVGSYQSSYEEVVDIGPATNYINQAAGTTVNITQYLAAQLDPDSYANLTNLNWSVTGYVIANNIPQAPGYPKNTLWYSIPRVSFGVQNTPPVRDTGIDQQQATPSIQSILNGAAVISGNLSAGSVNTTTFVQEYDPSANNQNYGAFISDSGNVANSDLQGNGPADINGNPINLENTTVAPFSVGVQSDLYELRPTDSANPVDPHTLQTSGAGYYAGYFTLNPDGTMTFTAASAPVPVFSADVTNGTAPLTVNFTDASTGTITNWFWNFGNTHTATISAVNTTSGNTSYTYLTNGSYNVTLTVTGPNGTNSVTYTNYVVVGSSTPPAPVAAFTGTPTVGFAPLKVIFSDTSTGSITNWLWTFGDGHTYTNTVSGTATNTYTTAGTYTVKLAVAGLGGANTNTQTGYVVASATPSLSNLSFNNGTLILGGTNGPVGVQYRILTTTNLTLAITNWTPVLTNTIPVSGIYGYTNHFATNAAAYFRLVSP
jgi:PKD repeat protein